MALPRNLAGAFTATESGVVAPLHPEAFSTPSRIHSVGPHVQSDGTTGQTALCAPGAPMKRCQTSVASASASASGKRDLSGAFAAVGPPPNVSDATPNVPDTPTASIESTTPNAPNAPNTPNAPVKKRFTVSRTTL